MTSALDYLEATEYADGTIEMVAKLVLIDDDSEIGPWAAFDEDFRKGNYVVWNVGFAETWVPGLMDKLEVGTNYRITGPALSTNGITHNHLSCTEFKIERRYLDPASQTVEYEVIADTLPKAEALEAAPKAKVDYSDFDPDAILQEDRFRFRCLP